MPEPLKDQFDAEIVKRLSERFVRVDEAFDGERFVATVLPALPDLELKQRINLVADQLALALPDSYPGALELVVSVVDAPDEPRIEGFAAWPLCSFVERHGLDHADLSLQAMDRLTRHWSCEFAVRPYLQQDLELTRSHLRRWARDGDEAVRRLASEGTRPRLPWGPRVAALTEDPEIGLELLRELRHDPSETVRRSVANHLNDLARTHPDRVVAVTAEWSTDPTVDPSMIRHALRTLVKTGHPGALGVLGFTTTPEIAVDSFRVTPAAVRLGSHIELTATIRSRANRGDQRLVVDFVIHHIGATGSSSPKVFKWTTLDLGPDESATITKRRLIETASTRRYHAGEHRVDLQVSGTTVATAAFELHDSSV